MSSSGVDIDVDFCVFGSGPAGLTVAESLAMSGASVALVEQGPRFSVGDRGKLIAQRDLELRGRDLDFGSDWPTKFKNSKPVRVGPHPYSYSFVSGVGGASMHWDAHTPRPTEEDLKVRSLYGYGRDWPISYAELEPWLLKAEHKMGVSANDDNPYASPRSGPFPMPAHPASYFESEILTPGMAKLGWKTHSRANAVASEPYQGRSGCLGCRACTVCPSGARYAADRVSIPGYLAQPKASLYTEVKLRRLELSSNGRSIAAGLAVGKDGKERVFRAKRYVLCLGGVETPRMLMLSTGKGHAGGLGNVGGQLGEGFSDHPMTFFRYLMDRKVGHSLGFPAFNCEHFRSKDNRKDRASFSINMIPAPIGWDFVPTRYLVDKATLNGTLSLDHLRKAIQSSVVGYGLYEHTGGGRMVLDGETKDEWGDSAPRITLDITERDQQGFRMRHEAAKKLGEVFGGELTQGDPDNFFWGSHPSGGTAMGRSAATGVCDANLRVMGMQNLYLVSSSVFPHQGANNPTLTIVALALRLAAHLRSK